ncbi:hypothetical protein CROQUDRAFT_44418 [Cronartium quercuum f. sp. fusiforme G11]|uniref:MoaB/Mog domain-containing protein n=1 Tax=Cronartium quercuum f. sp. fusiforme G11 TaxID=708437 RepID=A0A9P6NN03_9BASI|nr:hypothetical protein CROQUDRAFT_44418 [Cronartium quercuum f. sp. fusiforme G11]
MMMSTTGPPAQVSPHFPVTPPDPELASKTPARHAACIIIGDEILNGKTLDTNSNHLAGLLFRSGISLDKIEIVPDVETEIVECVRRLSQPETRFDLIFTSGGIGPTHDDITYQSLAKVWDPKGELEYDPETISRMNTHLAKRQPTSNLNPDQEKARKRMALFPKLDSQVLFVVPHLWVPVVNLKKKLFILPGVPTLFTQLVDALVTNYIPLPPTDEKQHRQFVSTTLPESSIAPCLSRLASELAPAGIKIGSYPNFGTGQVTVSIIGPDSIQLSKVALELEEEFSKLLKL